MELSGERRPDLRKTDIKPQAEFGKHEQQETNFFCYILYPVIGGSIAEEFEILINLV